MTERIDKSKRTAIVIILFSELFTDFLTERSDASRSLLYVHKKIMFENIEHCINGKRDCLRFNYCIRLRSQNANAGAELKISKNTLAIQDSFRPIPKVSK